METTSDILSYLRAVVEGDAEIEPWVAWFSRHEPTLHAELTRTEYLRLKQRRIRAITAILQRFGIAFTPSDRYAYLGGVPGRCRDCGSPVVDRTGKAGRGFIFCPRGCFRMHVLVRPEQVG